MVPSKKPKSVLEKEVAKYLNLILTGRMLVVDPSSSSRSSQPGYALFEGGVLKDMGVLEISPGMALNRKLHRLVSSLRADFPKVDVLVIELISPFFGKRGFNKPNVSLQRACGATMGGVEAEVCLEVAPVSWHKYMPDGYTKNDAGDALLMGLTVLRIADQLNGVNPEPRSTLLYEALNKYRSGRG